MQKVNFAYVLRYIFLYLLAIEIFQRLLNDQTKIFMGYSLQTPGPQVIIYDRSLSH